MSGYLVSGGANARKPVSWDGYLSRRQGNLLPRRIAWSAVWSCVWYKAVPISSVIEEMVYSLNVDVVERLTYDRSPILKGRSKI